MSARNDGGHAFPVSGLHGYDEFRGMTLRDYFAAKAMQAMVSNINGNGQELRSLMSVLSDEAFHFADAMLAARGAA